MDDSDQDFEDLCSRFVKRVRKKPSDRRQPSKAATQPSSQASDGNKKTTNNKRDGDSGSKCVATQPVCAGAGADQHVVCGGTGFDSGDAGSSVVSAPAGSRAETSLSAKDKVLQRMQQFKRAPPKMMAHKDKSQTTTHEIDCVPPPVVQRQDTTQSFSSVLNPVPQDSDEALALWLQQELNREAVKVQTVNLEDEGLFFCQICHKDLSHMTPEGRTQHLNRCLDESEESAPAPPPPPPGVPDCPICGKKFKSQKSRSAHLKRCSSDMGVPPAVLLQVLQRQSEETQNVPTANTLAETAGTKRKGPSKQGLPARKKSKEATQPLDEDTMVALALSSSLLEQERELDRRLQAETGASHISMNPVLKWRPDSGVVRGRRKKGAVPRPPPLLLIQDTEAALSRLQERVSALLLRNRPPSPPTPTRCPSSLPGWSGAAPLWQKSALLGHGSTCLSDFYTPELREFIMPWVSTTTDAASTSTINKHESSLQPASVGSLVKESRTSILPSSSQTAASSPAPSTPGTGQLQVGSQTLQDLIELAEDGMTLTQCGYTDSGAEKENGASLSTNLYVSGFIFEESEERAERPCSDKVTLSRLASDLSSMVNNPQLSDLQLQVDSGEVYFAHSFMVYARCPLLAEMVHESGFGVQEEGMPAAQRVLMSDVPGQAVFALLKYLYTARCSVPASLRPHVMELASRFDLKELQQLCELRRGDSATQEDEEDLMNQEEDVNNQTDQAFVELLHSMWNEEGEDSEGADPDGRSDEERGLEAGYRADDLAAADREICEEKVNEEELEEIYEFAATQRKREEEKDSMEEEEVDEVEEEDMFSRRTDPKRSSEGLGVTSTQQNSKPEPDSSLDRSYSCLFSDSLGVYEEGEPAPSYLPSTSGQPKTHILQSEQHQPCHKPSSELSGRTVLQSSLSITDDLSLNTPPSTSKLPIPGQSPGQVADCETDAANMDVPLKRESRGPRSICVPCSPDSSQKMEPELIVLSDSSEEMEVVLSSRSPSPIFPDVDQKLQSYTQIKHQPVCNNGPTLEKTKSCSLKFSLDDVSAGPVQSHPGSRCDRSSPVDCSPEVSWLIPSTPLEHGGNTTTSSTQTRSSMRRTRLFPKGDSSLSPTSMFSSPALSFNNRRQTSNSPTRVSTRAGDAEVFAVPPSQSERSHPSCSSFSKQDVPFQVQLQPQSSTPLHLELQKLPVPLTTSPLQSSLDNQRSADHGGDKEQSGSPGKSELESFHLTPLSDPSDPPPSTSHRGPQNSQRHSNSPCQSRLSVESSSHNKSEGELTRGMGDGEGGTDSKNVDMGDEGGQEEATGDTGTTDAAESSFQQSFMAMDEPPIAFNDSWGLDVCVDVNPGRFSLRLEDSGESSQQERSRGQHETTGSSSCQPSTFSHTVRSAKSHNGLSHCSPPKAHSTHPSTSVQARTGPSITPSLPDPTTRASSATNNSLLDSKLWDSWDEEEEEGALPLSQRVNPSAQLKTPKSLHNKRRRTLVPITPMPHYSDMDTPELKNKLNRFGVRPLPKRQMILKLKEIHQYTHQLVSSDSEEEASISAAQIKPVPTSSVAAGDRPVSCALTVKFKEPRAPLATSPLKHNGEEEAMLLSASQGSNTSSTAASEESESSNPELCLSSESDSDSDGGISASQVATRLQDRLAAVRSFILSDSGLYTQILQYQPLVLSQLQERLKTAGIRLGAAKLVDYLDSQCITFTTAKPGQSAHGRRRGKRAKAAGDGRASKKKAMI